MKDSHNLLWQMGASFHKDYFSHWNVYTKVRCKVEEQFCKQLKEKDIVLPLSTPGRRQSKTPILSRIVDQKSIETVFLNAICRSTGDKWQSKTLFLSIFIRVRRLLTTFSIAAYPVCYPLGCF